MGVVSGFLKEHESAEENVLREVKEETGLNGKINKSGKSFEVLDQYGRWIIIPFLVNINSQEIYLDKKEHSEYKWINPSEISKFDSVADLKKDLEIIGLL